MALEWQKKRFEQGRRTEPAGQSDSPQVGWLSRGDNPWGVQVLDVRPVTLGMLSTSRDQQCALNAMSFGQDDGTGFVGIEPEVTRQVRVGLQFRIDRMLADGALFLPEQMEHKWALYFHRGRMIFIRSWQRQVVAVAETRAADDFVSVTAVRGAFVSADEEPEFTVRVLDFLLRSHALDLVYPAPLPQGVGSDPRDAALWCMSVFGNRAHFATSSPLTGAPPEEPLRTHSLLHIAVARGDASEVMRLLDAGVPVDLLARGGLAPLHWAVARDDTGMLGLLLERGSPVDVRSVDGATALMNAVQSRSGEKVAFLLDRGADPNSADERGFTALHRASEMGERDIVRLLLDRGASAHPEAQGHTPRSLAASRGEKEIVELLDRC
jgi:hypothetical protein